MTQYYPNSLGFSIYPTADLPVTSRPDLTCWAFSLPPSRLVAAGRILTPGNNALAMPRWYSIASATGEP